MGACESGIWIDPGPIRAGEHPYVCDTECNALLTPDVGKWYAPTEEELPPPEGGEIGVEGASESQSNAELFRLSSLGV